MEITTIKNHCIMQDEKYINQYLLILLIVPLSITLGIVLTVYYIQKKILKILGIKNWKELQTKMKQTKKLQKQMEEMRQNKTNPQEAINNLLQDPQLKKQMEELKKMLDKN